MPTSFYCRFSLRFGGVADGRILRSTHSAGRRRRCSGGGGGRRGISSRHTHRQGGPFLPYPLLLSVASQSRSFSLSLSYQLVFLYLLFFLLFFVFWLFFDVVVFFPDFYIGRLSPTCAGFYFYTLPTERERERKKRGEKETRHNRGSLLAGKLS